MSKFNGFFDNFSKALGNPKGNLGDYAHASALYVRNNLRLTPKAGFLYHVVIKVNPIALGTLGNNVVNLLGKNEFSLLVSSVDLPRYDAAVEVKNVYNRKKLIQTRMNHQPCKLDFHDDMAGLTTLLWEAYYRYYYQDPNYAEVGADGQPSNSVPTAFYDTMYQGDLLNRNRYGLDRKKPTTAPFFDSITVNQLHPQNGESKYTSFTLINPLIASYNHDTMSYAESGFTSNNMTVQYEAVTYGRGFTKTDSPAGFADPAHYDVTPSPLSIEGGGTTQLFGKGGVVEGFTKVFRDAENGQVDLNTILTAFNTFNQAKNLDKSDVKSEFEDILLGGALSLIPGAVNGINNFLTGENKTATNSNSINTGNAAIFNVPKSQAISFLQTNKNAAQDFAFSQVYSPAANTGNLNDRKAAWNALPDSVKNGYVQQAINDFDNIKAKSS